MFKFFEKLSEATWRGSVSLRLVEIDPTFKELQSKTPADILNDVYHEAWLSFGLPTMSKALSVPKAAQSAAAHSIGGFLFGFHESLAKEAADRMKRDA